MQASAFKIGDRFSEDTADFFAVQHYIVYPLDTGFYSAYLFDGSYNRYSRTCGYEERFVGFEIGAEKPSEEIYQAVIDGIGCEPSDILFFDDSDVNCDAARKMGLQARVAPANSAWLSFFTADGEYIPEAE